MKWLLIQLALLVCWETSAYANTEIAMFSQDDTLPMFLKHDLEVSPLQLSPSSPLFLNSLNAGNASASMHTFLLDLPPYRSGLWSEAVGKSGRWTFRVSWPASHPAFVSIQLLREQASRQVAAKVNFKRDVVLAAGQRAIGAEPVPVSITIEPVYLWFVPKLSLSLLAFLAVLLAVLGLLGVPSAFAGFVTESRSITKVD